MHFLILDINNLLCRAYFAGEKIYTSNNKPIGAICALAQYIQNLTRMLAPTHIAMARDMGSKTWRHQLYPQYKKNRVKSDEELYAQFPLVPVLAEYLGMPLVGHDYYEADDCIATLATQAFQIAHTTIVSTDKDLCQLVNDKVRIYNPHHKQLMTRKNIEEKYQIELERLLEYFALIGDSSDNLPGVSGIGPKTALTILKECKNVLNIGDTIKKFPPGVQKKLMNQEEQIALMKKLITLTHDVPLDLNFNATCDAFQTKGYKDISINAIKKLVENLDNQS